MIRRPPRSTLDRSSAASDVYKRQTWNTYLVYKWAPNGNGQEHHFTLQGEYFDRHEDGVMLQLNTSRGNGRSSYRGDPSGWYLQGVYQFMPRWRVGLRYDSLDSGTLRLRSLDGVLRDADFPTLATYDPDRTTLMLDYSPTEYSRLRLQYAHDQSAPGAVSYTHLTLPHTDLG